jgi:YidC/Oxa1 family membrane protein insertase
MGAFLQAPIFISFFFAIRNMAEKVPSFKEGGALWFTDLTTPDSFFILPVMSGLATLLTVEVLSASILPPFSLCGVICSN